MSVSGTSLYFGYMCEFDEQSVKIYDCKRGELIVSPNHGKERFDLCSYYKSERGVFKKLDRSSQKFHNVEFYLKGGEVYAKTWAVSPNPDVLPDETLEKYEDKVWSPSLCLMRDPMKLFCTKFKGGEKGWVTVRYGPDKNTVFEITDVHELNHKAVLNQLPPWEHEAEGDEPEQVHPSELVADKFRKVSPSTIIQYALCVGVNQPNLPNKQNFPGPKPVCNLLFNLRNGLIRWLPEGDNDGRQFGRWYSHKVNDRRKKAENKNVGMNTYHACTANNVEEIVPPLPTMVVDGVLQIETSFVFNHSVIEDEENWKVGDWSQRLGGFRGDAHFWDFYLGRVDIYPMEAMEVVQVIENFEKHFERWNPKEHVEFKADEIIISVRVRPHVNYYENSAKYPRCGLFLVKDILKIAYRRKNFVIFENWC